MTGEPINISSLPQMTSIPETNDQLIINDISEPLNVDKTKRISYYYLMNLAAQTARQALAYSQAAGDIFYAISPTALGRLGKGSIGQAILQGANAPYWGNIKGILAFGQANSTSEKLFSSDTWEDIPGASVTLSLPSTCTILMLATVTGYPVTTSAGYAFAIRGYIDGSADPSSIPFNGSDNPARNEALPYIWAKTSVPAGNKVVKIQCHQSGINRYVTNARLIALAFGE
jgi:hypothetical protein